MLLALILIQIFVVVGFLKKKKRISQAAESIRKSKDIFIDDYQDEFLSKSKLVSDMRKNKLIIALSKGGGGGNQKRWNELFNNAKNPWGITPSIFKAIRFSVVLAGLFIALMLFLLVEKSYYSILGIMISFLGWWYPMYFYKETANEREEEWDKMYEFIWVIKHTVLLYDARKVCLETKKYIESHYPKYTELITGFGDFYANWDDNAKEIPEYILKYYNFPVPKEIYNILFQMAQTGNQPEQSLNNLRVFVLNKHSGKVQKYLSTVPSKATISSLPFLMISVIIALLVPMIMTLIQIM